MASRSLETFGEQWVVNFRKMRAREKLSQEETQARIDELSESAESALRRSAGGGRQRLEIAKSSRIPWSGEQTLDDLVGQWQAKREFQGALRRATDPAEAATAFTMQADTKDVTCVAFVGPPGTGKTFFIKLRQCLCASDTV